MPAPLPTKTSKPNALEIFTDRIEQQQLLRELISPVSPPSLGAKALLTQFYGVGGVGKSTLYLRALEIAASDFKEHVAVVATCFDDNRWAAGTPFTEVLAELCRCLFEQKIIPQLTLALLSLHGQQTGRNGEVVGGLDAGWHMAFTAMEKGADLTGIPGLGMVVKGAQWVRERSQRHALRRRLVDLGLWPEEAYGKLNILDLEKKLSSALFYDLVDWLRAHPQRHLRFFLDGFERLQSSERREDAQRRLQEFVGFFANPDNRDACERCRVVIFGRNLLRWDEIYEDPSWREYWNLHLLGGLAEADARDFLKKTRVWLAAKGQAALTATLLKYEEKILDAADETVGGHRVFYPFYLKLAVELVERAQQAGKEFELGRAPAELQDRFFRYLEARELRALMVLALSEVFDEALFDWLAKERFIEYPQHSFHSQLRREHSYIQPVEGQAGEWRFHRIMEDALHARWHTTPELKREGGELLKRILDYYAKPLLEKPERDWADQEIESWRRGSEIIVKQGAEKELIGYGIWSALLDEKPWSIEHYRCLTQSARMLQRILFKTHSKCCHENSKKVDWMEKLGSKLYKLGQYDESRSLAVEIFAERKRVFGEAHLNTIRAQHTLAVLLRDNGEFAQAEYLINNALSLCEKALGHDHEETFKLLNSMGNLLKDTNRNDEAGRLYRRALESLEKKHGIENPVRLRLMNNLASSLMRDGKFSQSEELYCRVLDGLRQTIGDKHPDTLFVKCNLGLLYIKMGESLKAQTILENSIMDLSAILPKDHPNVLKVKFALAKLLKKSGHNIEASNLYLTVLKDRNLVLGPDHPATLKTVNSVFSVLDKQDNMQEALAILREHSSKSELCMDTVRYNLACAECMAGNYEESLRLIQEHIRRKPNDLGRALNEHDLSRIHDLIEIL